MQARWSISLVAVGATLAFACGSTDDSGLGGSTGGSSGSGGSAGASSGGSGGSATGGASGSGTGGTATGGTAGAATGGTAGAATGGSAGAGPDTCAELESAYGKALDDAKSCETGPGPVLACTELVPNKLACPCDTFVNPANTEDVNKLHALQEQWDKQKCALNVACPEIACPIPGSAVCSSSGGKGGHCQDVSVGTGN